MHNTVPSSTTCTSSSPGAPAYEPFPGLRPSQALGVPPLTDSSGDDSIPAEPIVNAYYDRARRDYLVKNSGGRWLALGDSQFKMLLRSKGFSPVISKAELHEGKTVSEVEAQVLAVQEHRDVGYAGPLAGRASGYYRENGENILVTDSPRLLTPAPEAAASDWPLIRHFLHGMLSAPEEPYAAMQREMILGWLAAAVQSLYLNVERPRQALVLAGPAGCGKSVLQNLIITPLLGGRAAKCGMFLQSRTSFNGELFGAEHLMLEDEHSDTRIGSRLSLASHVKQICVNNVHSCHAKHRPIINLSPFWRLTISLNDEPERLLIIPPLSSDVADKIIILRCHSFAWPMPVATPKLWKAFTTAMEAELPAFLAFLLAHEPSAKICDGRYGIAAWHHPDLARELEDMAPEAHLAQLIQRWLGNRREWKGTADELRTALLNYDDTARDARDLLHWQNACCSYLSRLADKRSSPIKVSQRRTSRRREWNIITSSLDDASDTCDA